MQQGSLGNSLQRACVQRACLVSFVLLVASQGCATRTPASAPLESSAATSPRAAPSPETTSLPETSSPRQATVQAVDPASAPPSTVVEAPPAPEEPPVDLLRSVRTDLAVSSAFRDRSSQAVLLADGDLQSAWNSRTGDLVGAWIEVRLPASVTVTSIELTAGFTKQTADKDLFTGNHRISRVRVTREGVEVGTYALDPESRELQSLPVAGPGGVYRIEVLEVVPGTREDWRETCVSELRILGRAADARVGERFPRFGVGALPEPRPEPGSTDRTELARELRRQTIWFSGAWGDFEASLRDVDVGTGMEGPLPEDIAGYRSTRKAILGRVAEFVGLVDEVQADGLRFAAANDPDWETLAGREDARKNELELPAAGFEAVAAWLGDDESRCQWARVHAGLRLHRIAAQVRNLRELADVSVSEMDTMGEDNRAMVRLTDKLYETSGQLDEIEAGWSQDMRSAAARLRRLAFPDDLGGWEEPAIRRDWNTLLAQIEICRSTCGWVRVP
jgi:hypothetical protein